ncbi:MAG: hypothetical protein SFU53_05890 [Terrimicrobiaceae bacterium]|nr:hypothetical protein [Terrimicrobiaceae bacterium]
MEPIRLTPPSPEDAGWMQFLESTPPRQLPANWAKNIAARPGISWVVLVIFGIMGLAFTLLFFPWGIWNDWALDLGPTKQADAEIVSVERTNLSINKRRVYRIDFRFRPERFGPEIQGTSHSRSQKWSPGKTAPVRFLESSPSTAALVGATHSLTGPGGFMVLIFPIIPLVLVLAVWVGRRRTKRLFVNGVRQDVRVDAIEPTNMSINRSPVFRFTLSGDFGHPITVRKWKPAEVSVLREAHERQQPVVIFADPMNPKRFVIPETLRLA